MTAQPRPLGPDAATIARVREPWMLYLHGTPLTVRGAGPQDLPGVALMHGRCSPKSLLDRYRTGGRAPAIIVLDRHVRDPLSFVVTIRGRPDRRDVAGRTRRDARLRQR